jgi:flagellar basal body rod protein FlgG
MVGIQTAMDLLNAQAMAIAAGNSGVQQMVGLLESQRSVEANVALIRAGDETIGSVLDVLA